MDEYRDILERVDHTLLDVDATWDGYVKLCEEALEYKPAAICVPSSRVGFCVNRIGDIPVCTTISFPNGYAHRYSKAEEVNIAAFYGAKEFDMVINVGDVKSGDYEDVLLDITTVVQVVKKISETTGEKHILKVIIETSLLTDDEKKRMCEIVGESGADYIKTSTGFYRHGATFEDVELLRKYSPPHVKVKAAGGIHTLGCAREFIRLGADRLGTSKIVNLIKGKLGEDY